MLVTGREASPSISKAARAHAAIAGREEVAKRRSMKSWPFHALRSMDPMALPALLPMSIAWAELPSAHVDAEGESPNNLALLSRRVTLDIKELILSGDSTPGSRVRREELALRFGTSRIPVREALRYPRKQGARHPQSETVVRGWRSSTSPNASRSTRFRERIEPWP